MKLLDVTGNSKIAAHIRRVQDQIKKQIIVTVAESAPESIPLTGFLPSAKGWRFVLDVPLKKNNRKDYVKFIKKTDDMEIWIRVSTVGGRSNVYVR